jgi:NAD(P)-dependent dehydrogenase (short-subunit alcohol dehydrogenase family)
MVRYDSLKGKVAICTGGGSGMARAASILFAENGAKVAVVGRNSPSIDDTVSVITKAGGTAISIKADMGKAEDIERMVKQTVEAFGRLDFAFNSVGTGGGRTGFTGTPNEVWDTIINLDLDAIWLCMKHEIPEMLKVGGGAIVNNSSVAGIKAQPMRPAYAAAKHGVVGLSKSVAASMGPENIRVNTICPGFTDTKMLREDYSTPGDQEKLIQMVPLRRIGKAEDVANMVLFLCSDEGSYITGATIPIDGGMSA